MKREVRHFARGGTQDGPGFIISTHGLDREHGAHAPDRGLPRQELPRLGLDRYGRGPEEADAGALDGVLDLAEARLDLGESERERVCV